MRWATKKSYFDPHKVQDILLFSESPQKFWKELVSASCLQMLPSTHVDSQELEGSI